MRICAYVCMYTYLYALQFQHKHTYTYTHTIHTSAQATATAPCAHVCMYVYIFICAAVPTHIHIHAHNTHQCPSYGYCSGMCKGCERSPYSTYSFVCISNSTTQDACKSIQGQWDSEAGVCIDPSRNEKSDMLDGCSAGFSMRTCADLSQAQCSASGLEKLALYNGQAGE